MNAQLRLDLYRRMLRIRVIEEVLAKVYASEQMMRCPAHFSIGQEAVAVAVSCHLSSQDQVMSAHRSHAHYLAKGGPLPEMVAELYGKASGATSGRGGSMHLVAKEVGFAGATPIVGSTIPIAAGIAFADVLLRRQRVTVVYFGDGATETGVFHETLGFAALHALPVVFACENNRYAMETDFGARQSHGRSIVALARAHGLSAIELDGQDVEAAYLGLADVFAAVRAPRPSPYLVEFHTYRFIEHCGPRLDPTAGYRPKGEYEHELARDPVTAHRQRLVDDGFWSPEQEEALQQAIRDEIKRAFEFARSSPFPERDELLKHVYAEMPWDAS
jgi:pyruvate dehydrogenase E1 component alpha subunit